MCRVPSAWRAHGKCRHNPTQVPRALRAVTSLALPGLAPLITQAHMPGERRQLAGLQAVSKAWFSQKHASKEQRLQSPDQPVCPGKDVSAPGPALRPPGDQLLRPLSPAARETYLGLP